MSGEIDPDVDLRVEGQRRELVGHHVQVLGAIALGGGLGAVARYGLAQAMPVRPGQFPWATFVTNVSGCLLIGVLMVLVARAHRLVRPFFGVGVLGGFTTFSTYAVEFQNLLRAGQVGLAFAYLAGTLVSAVIAVLIGVKTTRSVVRA
ncbi:fluoride efflux transporter CrcB [Actinocrispum wychmicini]|uniref:fluoride efflux transporter CrcB n=1 Tax=Actinocrispum wychmicini TaxID=1213861 RepID=UPI001FB82A3C